MSAAQWARDYQARLLAQLEAEANEGWPSAPPPPSQGELLGDLIAVLAVALTDAERDGISMDPKGRSLRRPPINTPPR